MTGISTVLVDTVRELSAQKLFAVSPYVNGNKLGNTVFFSFKQDVTLINKFLSV